MNMTFPRTSSKPFTTQIDHPYLQHEGNQGEQDTLRNLIPPYIITQEAISNIQNLQDQPKERLFF